MAMRLFYFSLLSFSTTSLSIYLLIPFFKKYLPDIPNQRSSHKKITPRGCGIIFVILGSIFSLANQYYPPLLALPIAIVGFIDDKHDISYLFRFAIQIATSIAITYGSIQGIFASDYNNYIVTAFISLIFLLIPISTINILNFMDGIDGLIAGCMSIILFFSCILINVNLLPILFALLGFFLWNWHPAKVFMGDAGSTYLGAIYAIILFQSNSITEFIEILILGTSLFGDASICLSRRIINKQPIFQPHRLHTYQRLNQAGWSHSQVSSIYILSTVFIGFTLLLGGLRLEILSAILIILLLSWLDRNKAIPFLG